MPLGNPPVSVSGSPLTGPTPWWLPEHGSVEAGGASRPSPSNEGPFPGESWPSLHAVEYASKLIVLLILILALPWIFKHMLTNPDRTAMTVLPGIKA